MRNGNNRNLNVNYNLKSFQLHYGKVIENIDVDYTTYGNPIYDDEGNIINAIVFCPTYKGSQSVLQGAHSYLKNEGTFKGNEFYFITITSFGLPPSYSPSSSDLKNGFPEYNLKDIVNFKRNFLAEKFKIKQLLGVMGEEDGGYEVFTWACEYPDDMRFILLFNSDFRVSGYRYIINKGYEAIVDMVDHGNVYDVSLSKAIVAINTFLFAQASSEKVLNKLSNDEIEVLLEDFIDEGLYLDVYDVSYRIKSILNYNVENQLSDIKAKTLVIYSDDNVLFNEPMDLKVLKENIDDVNVLSYSSKKENYYDEEDYSLIGYEVISFFEESIETLRDFQQ